MLPENFPTVTIRPGTLLYHGTDEPRRFKIPHEICWFSLDWLTAARWAGWTNYDKQRPRWVYAFSLGKARTLPDTRELRHWQGLAQHFLNDPDPLIYDFADALRRNDVDGWYGDREVMLCKTADLLVMETKCVPPHIKPCNRA